MDPVNIQTIWVLVLGVVTIFGGVTGGLVRWIFQRMERDHKDLVTRIDTNRDHADDSRRAIHDEMKNHTTERSELKTEVGVLTYKIDSLTDTISKFDAKLERALGFAARSFTDRGDLPR